MNYKESIAFLNTLINYEKGFEKYNTVKYNPDRVGELLAKLKLSYSPIKIIHIAGTKGKGSTAAYIAKLLELSTGEKTGLYTSPHLFRLNERISINFHDIPDEVLAALVSKQAAFLKDEKVTYFEALTFLAMVYFIQEGCQWVVLETGLGGRLDSTNFCQPVLSVITPISFDHTAILGNTLAAIAGEKAGIIKQEVPVTVGVQKKEALKTIRTIAKGKNAPIFFFNDLIKYKIRKRSVDGSLWNASIHLNEKRLILKNIKLLQIGDAFVENFLLAVLSCLLAGISLEENIIRQAALLEIPYRIKRMGNWIIDVAHNDSSFEALFRTIRDYFPKWKIHLYVGILADKEIQKIAGVIWKYRGLISRLTCFDFKSSRGSGGKLLYKELRKMKNSDYQNDISALSPNPDEFSVFAGSFYIIDKIINLKSTSLS